MHPRTLLLAAALGLAACRGGSAPAPAPAPAHLGTASGTLRVSDATGATGPVKLAELGRLVLDATYAGEAGAHAVRFDVTAPSGMVFTQLRGPLAADAAGQGSSHRELQMRGTPATDYHMTGTWHFTLVVDDTPLASASIDVTE